MVRHFFADTARMQPADYGDIQTWSENRGLGWAQKEIVEATSILAKLRGQLRPLRFEKYSLDEFTIGPSRCVVPTEYRVDVLRSWRTFTKKVGWRECLLDNLESCVPFLERLEETLRDMLEESDIIMNPEVIPEGLLPLAGDILIGRRLLRICGEKKPDMYMWTESWLTSYLFVSCGFCRPIEDIQILHPFHGLVWTYKCPDLIRAKLLYDRLMKIWLVKNP